MINPSSTVAEETTVVEEVTFPDASQLITEDDQPVDNFASAKQQRLLVGSLYSALSEPIFLSEANVGIYHTFGLPAIVPDVFVSFDVAVPVDWWDKPNRCYLMWNFGKPPEVVVEIVSNRVGNELETKLRLYERMRVNYYVVYDPSEQLGEAKLRVFELRGRYYAEMPDFWLEDAGFGLTIWQGSFEGRTDSWLRWCDRQGKVLLTGDEKAEQANQKAEQANQKAEQANQKAEQANQRAERLAEMLRAQGINPDEV